MQEADLGHKVQSLQETGNSAGQGLKYLTAALKERVRGLTLLYRLLTKTILKITRVPKQTF